MSRLQEEISPITQRLFQSYLEDGESIHLIFQEHFFRILKQLTINIVVFFILPFTVIEVVPKLNFIALPIILIGLWRCFYQSISWYFNSIVITNLNIVVISWNGFFDRSAQRIEYNQIESFSYQITGFLNTIIDRGTLNITKNSGTNIPIENMYQTKKKTQILTQVQDQFMTNHQTRQSGAIKDLLTGMLEKHIIDHGITVNPDQ